MFVVEVGGVVGIVDIVFWGGFGYILSLFVVQSNNFFFFDVDCMFFIIGVGVVHGDFFELVSGLVSWDGYFIIYKLAEGVLKLVDVGPYWLGLLVEGCLFFIGGHLWFGGLQWGVGF